MATFFIHRCNSCNYEITTSGPHEFYRDGEGKIRWYGHPDPISEEARKAGVHGLRSTCYCSLCDKTFEYVTMTFPSPVVITGRDSPWFHLNEGKNNPEAPRCPHCGNTKIVFDESDVDCPRCQNGKLVRRRDIMRLS